MCHWVHLNLFINGFHVKTSLNKVFVGQAPAKAKLVMVAECSNSGVRGMRETLVHWFSVHEEAYIPAPYWVAFNVIQSALQQVQVQLCGQWDHNASVMIPASPELATR
jgi:hypothetical protein